MNIPNTYIHYECITLLWICHTYTYTINIKTYDECAKHIHAFWIYIPQECATHIYTVNIQTHTHILSIYKPTINVPNTYYTVDLQPHHDWATYIHTLWVYDPTINMSHTYIHCKSCHTYKYIVNIKLHKEIPHIRKLSIYKPTMNVPHTYTCTVNIQPHHKCATRIRTKSCDIQDPNKCWCVTRTERKTSVDTRHDVIKQFRVYRLRQCVATSSSLVWFQRDSIHKTNKNWRFERILPNPKKISGKRQLNKEVSKQNNSFGDISLGLKKIFFKRIRAELSASTRAQ